MILVNYKFMTNDERKILQDLQTHRGWPLLEEFAEQYIKSLGLTGTIKMPTEFDTIWNRAYNEGGEYHLNKFLEALENEARKYL